jgi:hypothetical protein
MELTSTLANQDYLLIADSCHFFPFEMYTKTKKNQLVSRVSCKTNHCEWAHDMCIQLVMHKRNKKHWSGLNLNNLVATEMHLHPFAMAARQNDAK